MKILISKQDRNLLSRYKWHISKNKNRYYAMTYINGRHIAMHILILNPPKGMDVDHIDGNGLNNKRKNIRIATRMQNSANQCIRINNTTGYKGVFFAKDGRPKPWYTQIQYAGKVIGLGSFYTPEEAVVAYDRKAVELWGEFARTNRMMGRIA